MELWTVGHSTHPLERLVELVGAHRIELVADVRTVPKSKRHPHFHTDALARSLPEAGLAYVHLPRLGGWRRPEQDSPNGAWRNRSFQGYADYALTADFAAGLDELRALARERRTAIMCSEALWWRCHRRLVADRVVAGGDAAWHIGSGARATAHALTPFGTVREDGTVVYPPEG